MGSPKLIPELYCSSLEKTLEFYVSILDFKILYQRTEEKFVFLDKEGAQIMIEEKGIGRNWITGELEYPFGRGVNFQIQVEDTDMLYRKLQEKGLSPFMPIEEKWYRKGNFLLGSRQFIIQDPDGYLLRFFTDLGKKNIE